MILFDTSVIIDARDKDSPWHEWAKDKIADAVSSGGGAAVNTVVVAEASVRAFDADAVPALLAAIGMTLVDLPVSAAIPAAKAYAAYLDRRRALGQSVPDKTPLPDFLIGAHAHAEGLTLVTRDPGRIRTYFPKVELVVP